MDQNLWSRLQQGDKQALEAIYRSQVEALLQYGLKFTPDQSVVEDCLHDLFVRLWQRHEQLGATSSVEAYLFASLRRAIIKRLKEAQRYSSPERQDDPIFGAELAIDALIVARELTKEQGQQLEAAFSQLSDRQREAIYLRYYQEMDYEAISAAMDINYQSVRNLVSGGIRKLRTAFAGQTSIWFLIWVLIQGLTNHTS